MRVASYFQDDMVMQRNKPICIFGFCSKNEKIYIRLEKNRSLIYKEEGIFTNTFIFNAPIVTETQEKITITVTGCKSSNAFSIYIGDVFLLAGQSNMSYPFYVIDDYPIFKEECKNDIHIRYLNLGDGDIDVNTLVRPLEQKQDIGEDKRWFNNGSIKDRDAFSGIGVVFAHEYYKKNKVPVGMVNVSVGGASIDSFLQIENILNEDLIKSYLIKKNKIISENIVELSYTQPSGIFNEKVSPLKNINWQGVFWYQGESNVGNHFDAYYYRHSLAILIKGYRDFFMDDDLLFGCIQIANNFYPQDKGYGIPYINEAIQDVVKNTANTFSVPIYDLPIKWKNPRIGEAAILIHPTNKIEVAKRLYQIVEDPKLVPYISDYKINKSNIFLTVNNVKEGLKTSDSFDIQGFTIANEKGVYYKANAEIIDKNIIVVSNPHITNPSAVMYGFYLYNLNSNVINSRGFPLLIYRSCKENKDEDKYLAYHPLFDLSHENVLELGFFPLIANPSYKKRFEIGNINLTGNLTVNYIQNEGIMCNFIAKKQEVNYFGISPNIDLCGTKLRILLCDVCEIFFESSNSSLVCKGILVKTTDNSVVQFPAVSIKEVAGHFSAKITFKKGFNVDLTTRIINTLFLREIKQLQFLFEVRDDVDVKITRIDFYKGNLEAKPI